jgi:hypothetical protein
MNAALVVIDFTVKQRAPVAYVQSMATWEYFLLLVDLCLGAGQTLDTPRGLTPDGCSGDAHRAPARSRLKGRPLWSVDRIARRAALHPRWLTRGAPRPPHQEAVPHGTDGVWNRQPAGLDWGGARVLQWSADPQRSRGTGSRRRGRQPPTPDRRGSPRRLAAGERPTQVSVWMSMRGIVPCAVPTLN